MRRYLYWGISALAVVGVVVTIALFAGPIGERALPEGVGSAEAGGTLSSCYPGNQFSYNDAGDPSGPAFKSSGSGTATFWESEVEYLNRPPFASKEDEDDEYFGGKIVWSFSQAMTSDSGAHGDPYVGNFGGFLIATIYWDNGTQTKFVSRCLAEVQTIGGDGITEAELAAEGTVYNFPELGTTGNAVATLVMKRQDPGTRVQVSFGLNLGSICFKGSPESEFHVGATNLESETSGGNSLKGVKESGNALGVLKSPASTAGAVSFPAGSNGFIPTNCDEING
jgi:hypothetical protein